MAGVGVVVFDEHEVTGIGRAVALRRRGHRAAVGDLRSRAGRSADLVLGVVHRAADRWDRFESIERLAPVAATVESPRRVAVVDGGGPVDPLVARRLALAGFTELVPREAVLSIDGLDALASGRLAGAVLADPCPWGLPSACDPGAVVRYVLDRGRAEPGLLAAFDDPRPLKETGVSRRRSSTIRRRITELGALHPSLSAYTGGAERDRSVARWSVVVDFVNRCRGWHPDDVVSAALPTAAGLPAGAV